MSTKRPDRIVQIGKPIVFLLCLAPLAWLSWRLLSGEASANPIEVIIHDTGNWALRLLLVTLAMTPLRRLTGRAWLIRFRRMLGLFSFFYASLHLTAYLWLDQRFRWNEIIDDIMQRPYITVGVAAILLMTPLAVTSTRGWIKRLGPRWKTLHRLVYPIAILGILHYWWLVKADWREPALYAGILSLLLLARLPTPSWQRPRDSTARA
jgi:sulfoxide reductase heme-binding subunit YedZ